MFNVVNGDDAVTENWIKCTQTSGYPWERKIKKLKSLICLTIIYLSPKKDVEREYVLIKELELLSSGYMGFRFIFIEKNNSVLL